MIKKYITREVKIGFLVVCSGVILFFGFNYLKGINIFNPANYYQTSYTDIDGLIETSPVFSHGHKIGQVSKINYDFSKQVPFIVTLDIANDVHLPKGTVAELCNNGLVGGKAIRFIYPKNISEVAPKGDLLPSSVEPSLMGDVQNLLPKVQTLLESTDSLMRSVRALAESKQLKNSLNSIEHITADLEASSSQLKTLMNNDVPKIAQNVDAMTKDFATIGSNVSKIDFAQTVNKVDNAMTNLDAVSQKINSGKGTLGLLVNDPTLYNNLSSTSKSADNLLVDMKQNPKRYVHFSIFGGKKEKEEAK